MTMTESEAIKEIETSLELAEMCTPNKEREKEIKAYKIAIQALEEIQQYRTIGTVKELQSMKENGAFNGIELAQIAVNQMELKKYRGIGTVEEFKALKEKNESKKPIRNDECTCPSCGTHNEIIKKRRNTVAFDTVYCWHCGQALEIRLVIKGET